MRSPIKKAKVYRFTGQLDLNTLQRNIESMRQRPIVEGQIESHGFVPVREPHSQELVEHFGQYVRLNVSMAVRKLPAAVKNKALNKAVQKYMEENDGAKPPRGAKKEMAEEVELQLTPKQPPRYASCSIAIDLNNNLMYLDASTKKIEDYAKEKLLAACEDTVTLQTAKEFINLGVNIDQWVRNDMDAPHPWAIDDSLALAEKDGGGRISLSGIELGGDESGLQHYLDTMHVVKLKAKFSEQLSMAIESTGVLRSLRLSDDLADSDEIQSAENEIEELRATEILVLGQLAEISKWVEENCASEAA